MTTQAQTTPEPAAPAAMSTERPILFSAPMVRAILAGQKTQTRRVCNDFWQTMFSAFRDRAWDALLPACPYGTVGTRLWVRETFAPDYFGRGKPGYRADWTARAADVCQEPRWKPSIHMPRHASRITLEVTAVRVERLQEITEDDARAEGVTAAPFCKAGRANGLEHVESFELLWDSINGKRPGCSWDANPWVWVVSFRVAAALGER